jgi:hypothetical protein
VRLLNPFFDGSYRFGLASLAAVGQGLHPIANQERLAALDKHRFFAAGAKNSWDLRAIPHCE